MMSSAGPRLATASILLAFQILILILELLVFNSTIKKHQGYTNLRQWFGPIGLALVGTILVPIVFNHRKAATELAATQCPLVVDADIAGQGVRIAAFVQVCVLVIVSLLGSFHPQATGMKEVGAGLVLTSTSLAIALIVRMARESLTPVDAAISAMILDGQNMALAIQLVAKETLSSRWQVRIVVAAQALGLGTIVAIVTRFNDRKFLAEGCSCFTVFWWGWLGGCLPFASSLEPSIFWTYFGCRFVAIAQASFHALWNMKKFDEAEKSTRDTADALKKLGAPLHDITYPHFTLFGEARYGEYPASVTFMYLFYGVLALTSLVIAETTIKDLNIVPSSTIDSTGQIIALVIAGATFVRAFFLFAFLFSHQTARKCGFKWPFKLQLSNFSSTHPDIIFPDLEYSDDDALLGSMLQDPFKPLSRYEGRAPIDPRSIQRRQAMHSKDSEYILRISDHGKSPKTPFSSSKSDTIHEYLMERQSFKPDAAYLKLCTKQPGIRHLFGAGATFVPVYLVVSVRIVVGLNRYPGSETAGGSGPVEASRSTGLHWDIEPVSAEMRRREEQAASQSKNGRALYSYRVQEYIFTSDDVAR